MLGGVSVTPMFPLGTVLLPGMLLPLHVFEPRYRQMVEDCRAGDGTFGVVLIERGSEVGGGDVRTDVGTLARLIQGRQLPDGRWVLAAVGERRLRVERWLPDDPYPRAEAEAWPDELGDPEDPGHRDRVVMLWRRAAALVRELGRPAPPLDLDLVDDPTIASYQAVAAAPLGEADRQDLLAAPTVGRRWAMLDELLVDQIELLAAQLAGS
jgi:uncharacterized protein